MNAKIMIPQLLRLGTSVSNNSRKAGS
jgi:hypothetical protein